VFGELIHTGGVQPTPDEIRHQLDRMLASDSFVHSDRLSRFLRYVVDRTLNGEGDRLKEYVLGTEVFDRDEQYDPRVDSIVRVEAGRLRAKIDEYYNHGGRNDPILIRMRRGSYTPLFERREARWNLRRAVIAASLLLIAITIWGATFRAPSSTRDARITIAVLPFATYSTDENVRLLAARVTDGVTTELARIGTLGVVSHTSAIQFAGMRRPLREIAQTLNADVIMEATLVTDRDEVRVDARLVDARRDRKFWVKNFEGTVQDITDLQQRIAAAVSAAAPGLPR
jgi:TolB-like protein